MNLTVLNSSSGPVVQGAVDRLTLQALTLESQIQELTAPSITAASQAGAAAGTASGTAAAESVLATYAPLASPAFTGTPTAPTATAGTNNTQLATTSFVANTAGDGTTSVALRNKFINGDFRLWQRGTTISNPGSTAYTADRWALNYDGSGATRVISLQSGAEDTDGSFIPQTLNFSVSAAGSGGSYLQLYQRIEDVNTLNGKNITISGKVFNNGSSTVTMPYIGYQQYFGSGGSAAVSSYSSPITLLPGQWTVIKETFALSSTVGKTLVSPHYIEVDFGLPPNTLFNLTFSRLQFEGGSVATPFELRPIELETSLCQRYFYAPLVWGWELGLGVATATNSVVVPIHLPAMMRANPTLSSSGISGTNLQFSGGITSNPTAVTVSQYGQNVISIAFTSTATTGTTGHLVSPSGNGVLQFSAEL